MKLDAIEKKRDKKFICDVVECWQDALLVGAGGRVNWSDLESINSTLMFIWMGMALNASDRQLDILDWLSNHIYRYATAVLEVAGDDMERDFFGSLLILRNSICLHCDEYGRNWLDYNLDGSPAELVKVEGGVNGN